MCLDNREVARHAAHSRQHQAHALSSRSLPSRVALPGCGSGSCHAGQVPCQQAALRGGGGPCGIDGMCGGKVARRCATTKRRFQHTTSGVVSGASSAWMCSAGASARPRFSDSARYNGTIKNSQIRWTCPSRYFVCDLPAGWSSAAASARMMGLALRKRAETATHLVSVGPPPKGRTHTEAYRLESHVESVATIQSKSVRQNSIVRTGVSHCLPSGRGYVATSPGPPALIVRRKAGKTAQPMRSPVGQRAQTVRAVPTARTVHIPARTHTLRRSGTGSSSGIHSEAPEAVVVVVRDVTRRAP